MNYEAMSTKELIHYLDLYSDDPLVRRLVKLLQEESLVTELVEAGMDPVTREFENDWNQYSPGEYIRQLRSDLDYYVRECDDLQSQIQSLEKEVSRMGTVNLISFIADVHHKLEMAKMEQGRAERIAENEKKLRKEAEQKFEFWDKMNNGIR